MDSMTLTAESFGKQARTAEDLCRSLNYQRFNWQPGQQAWSIGQCLEHLNIIAARLLPDLKVAIGSPAGPPDAGAKLVVHPGPVERLIIAAVAPQAKWKMPAPGKYIPASALEPEPVLASFVRHQEDLADCLIRLGDRDIRRKIASPALPLMRLRPAAWLLLTCLHQQRHLEQARRVRNLLVVDAA
jgi:hypothetical protein